MVRRLLLSTALASTLPFSATAASFFEFNIGWTSGGNNFLISGTTAPGQNTAGTYDVSGNLSFVLNGSNVGIQVYDGFVRNSTNTAWADRTGEVNVAFADLGGGNFSASFVAPNFTWFTGAGWDFTQSDQGGKVGYSLTAGNFYTHTAGTLYNLSGDQQGQFVPGAFAAVSTARPNGETTSLSSPVGTASLADPVGVIPLPAALPLLLSGLLGLGILGWRRRVA